MPTDLERLATVETEIKGIKDLILSMNAKLDAWQATFVPRTELAEMFRSRDREIKEIKTDIHSLQTEQIDVLKQEIVEMKTSRNTGKLNRPHWFIAAIAIGSLVISTGSLLYLVVHG